MRDLSLSFNFKSKIIDSARLVDEQAAEEVADCLKNSALRNRHTQLFHCQVRGSQRHNVVARKTREIAEIQGSTAALNARIEEEKELHHRSLNQQRDYEETLKQLPGESQTGSHMSIDLYGQRSTLRGKIADEKEKRRNNSESPYTREAGGNCQRNWKAGSQRHQSHDTYTFQVTANGTGGQLKWQS